MRKYGTRIAAFLLILLGLIRGAGGMLLLKGGKDLDLGMPIVATDGQLAIAGYNLIIVCALMVIAGLVLTARHDKASWIFAWVSIALFLVNGVVNGILLFGHPLISGQLINFAISGLIALLLVWSKQALRK